MQEVEYNFSIVSQSPRFRVCFRVDRYLLFYIMSKLTELAHKNIQRKVKMMTDTKSTRRAEQKENTRQAILEVAKKLFAEKGFENTTTRDIAKNAHIAIGTVFLHFPDKSSLLAAALYEGIEDALENAYLNLPDELSIKKKLLSLAAALYDHNFQNPSLTRVLLKETIFMEGEWGEAIQAQSINFIGSVTELLCLAQARGELKADANLPLLATAFFSNYFMILINALREKKTNTNIQIEMLSQFIDLTLASALK